MEEIIEIVVSLVGLIFYWLLTSRKSGAKKKAKKVQAPRTSRRREQQVEPQEPEEVYEPPIEEPLPREEVEQEPVGKPLTFEDLLEQFTGGKSQKPVFEAPEDVDESQPTRNLPTSNQEYLDEYRPIIKGGERLMQPGEHTGSILKKSIEELPKPEISTPALRFDNYQKKNIRRRKNHYAKLLKDKNSLKNALIMKEIFDRKYF